MYLGICSNTSKRRYVPAILFLHFIFTNSCQSGICLSMMGTIFGIQSLQVNISDTVSLCKVHTVLCMTINNTHREGITQVLNTGLETKHYMKLFNFPMQAVKILKYKNLTMIIIDFWLLYFKYIHANILYFIHRFFNLEHNSF